MAVRSTSKSVLPVVRQLQCLFVHPKSLDADEVKVVLHAVEVLGSEKPYRFPVSDVLVFQD